MSTDGLTRSDWNYARRTMDRVLEVASERDMLPIELAREAGIRWDKFQRRMNGTVSLRVNELEAIADVLECDVLDLLPRAEAQA